MFQARNLAGSRKLLTAPGGCLGPGDSEPAQPYQVSWRGSFSHTGRQEMDEARGCLHGVMLLGAGACFPLEQLPYYLSVVCLSVGPLLKSLRLRC